MPQLLWIGCLESDEEFDVKIKKGYDLASAQVSQKNLIYGIERISNIVFDSINGSVLPPYPVYKDRIITSIKWHHKPEAVDVSVGYRNDKYLNRLNCKKEMVNAADDWVQTRYKGKDVFIFVYSMRSAPMAAACHIKKKIPRAKIYLIVTDLPQFMDLGQSHVKAILKKFDWFFIKNMQKYFDGFILYAEKMAEYLNLSSGKWILMEGSYDIREQIERNESKKLAIMYSGKLDKQYGLNMLIDAFCKINNPALELWLTGSGNAVDYIKEQSRKDTRIKFYGFLSNRKDVIEKQLQATLLINMRLPSERASAYCFPSKLFEYMATGVPVLSFRIEGIPKEYVDYLYFIEDETTQSIIDAINSVLKIPESERTQKGNSAKRFVLEKKNTDIQCKRIWEYVNGR